MKMKHKVSNQAINVPDNMLGYYQKRGYELDEDLDSANYPVSEKKRVILEILQREVQCINMKE